jgi:hypothetical protein
VVNVPRLSSLFYANLEGLALSLVACNLGLVLAAGLAQVPNSLSLTRLQQQRS